MTVPEAPEIEEKVYPLTPFDGNPVSRANMQFVLFYTLDADADRTKLSATMQQTFHQTMAQYPILYGKIQNSGTEVHVTRDYATGAGRPVFEEHRVSGAVAEIRAAEFNWAQWPAELRRVTVARGTEGPQAEAPLVQCVVAWMDDGLGMVISVDHTVADGVAVDLLLNKWARTARGQSEEPVVPDCDHQSFYQAIKEDGVSFDDWFLRLVDGLSADEQPVQAIGVTGDADSIERALMDNVHKMQVTPESLEQLKRDYPADNVPVMRLTYALLWQRYMRARNASSRCLLNVIHNARHHANRPYYVGNGVCPTYMLRDSGSLGTDPLDVIARDLDIHKTTGTMWLAFCRRMLDPQWFAKFLTVFSSPTADQLTISNISRIGLYRADFGFGIPVHATMYPVLVPGFTIWTPLGPDGGLLILWNMTSDVFHRLSEDPVFCKYVDIVF